MFKIIRNIGVTTLVTVITVVGLTSLAMAWPAAAADPAATAEFGGGGRGLCGETGRAAAAEALGLTVDELSAQMRAGETLANLAEAAGVEVEAVQDAVHAACNEAARERIEQAVAEGTFSRDKADWLLEGLDKGYWGSGVEGKFGPHGFGGGRPPRNFPPPATDSSNGGA